MAERNIAAELAGEWQELLAGLEPVRAGAPGAWLASGGPGRPSVAQLYAEMEDVREEWLALVNSAAVHRNAEKGITSQWTLRELLAHTASWGKEFRVEVERAARGEAFDYRIDFEPEVGPTAWNHEEVGKRQGMTLEQIRTEYDEEAERLEEIILGLEDARIAAEVDFPVMIGGEQPMLRSIGETVLAKCGHDRHHIERIRGWLEKQEKGEGQ